MASLKRLPFSYEANRSTRACLPISDIFVSTQSLLLDHLFTRSPSPQLDTMDRAHVAAEVQIDDMHSEDIADHH